MKTRFYNAQSALNRMWYGQQAYACLLYPVSLLYRAITHVRRFYLERYCQQRVSVPVIVVGNITVGGVGKTPMVVALAARLQARGLRVGIISRGYGELVRQYPHDVQVDDMASLVGDEPLLLRQKTGCPVVIAPKRIDAARFLLSQYHIQIIISDDGLQHYQMHRNIEIAVIDGLRGFGNGLCLPAGPLREDKKRLQQVDFIVVNGGYFENAYRMEMRPDKITTLLDGQSADMSALSSSKPVAAIAAIGHPQRLFNTLKALNISFNSYVFADHHRFQPRDFDVPEEQVVMTEKDAVKCRAFATHAMYVLSVNAVLDDAFWQALWSHEQLQGYI